ncbi:hypothetical protein HDU87_005204 [Geranomyces variabilis]|uniref:Myb-like domain-containing protein n=1 Tax=Geranomyces variabilis TaxID=109894 RepID=A0AAD5THR0_9FUNG|nr:hypothetical protein HDU87_005204 [Geranomyces variabilis]
MRDSPRSPSAAARGNKRARTTSPSSPTSSQTKRRKETPLKSKKSAEAVPTAPATMPRRSIPRKEREASEFNDNEELNDAAISDAGDGDRAGMDSSYPGATPDSRVIGIKAAVLIGLEVTGSLIDDNVQFTKAMWEDIRECEEYSQMIVAEDCDVSESVRRVKVLAAYDSLRRMQRHMHGSEESLLMTRRNLLEVVAHLLMSGMPPPSNNNKVTTKVLQEVFIQSYIHRRLLMISESSNETDDELADEDVALESLWNPSLPAVNAYLTAKVKSQVEAKIRKDSLDTLMEKHPWDTFYNAAQAHVRQIAEKTERDIDLAALAAEVKTHLLSKAADAESQKSVVEIISEDEDAGPESGQPSRDTSVDAQESENISVSSGKVTPVAGSDNDPDGAQPSGNTSADARESSENISDSSGHDDGVPPVASDQGDPHEDDELDPAVRGDIIAQLMAREEALAHATRAAKGKGRAETPTVHESPAVTGTPPIDFTPSLTSIPGPCSPLSKPSKMPAAPRSANKKAASTSRSAPNGACHKSASLADTPKAPARQTPKVAVATSPRPAASASRLTSAAAASCQLTDTGEPIVPAAQSPAPENSTAAASPSGRRRRVAWSRADEEELERGLAFHRDEYARWRAILVEGQTKGRFEGRTNVMLKDKARQMKEARKRAGLTLGGFQWATDRAE